MNPMHLLSILMALVFAKGQGKPGTYTTRDGRRTFEAGSLVPKDLSKDDLKQWQEAGYVIEQEEPQVREVGRRVEHDVPTGKKGAPRSRVSRADTPMGGEPHPSQQSGGEGEVGGDEAGSEDGEPDPDGAPRARRSGGRKAE